MQPDQLQYGDRVRVYDPRPFNPDHRVFVGTVDSGDNHRGGFRLVTGEAPNRRSFYFTPERARDCTIELIERPDDVEEPEDAA